MEFINSLKAPAAVGPYCQAVVANGFMFLTGQLGLDPQTKALVAGDTADQARQVFKNIQAVLAEKNLTLKNVVKATVFMKSLADFPKMNAVYTEFMGDHKPARSTFEVAGLPLGALIEIECMAVVS